MSRLGIRRRLLLVVVVAVAVALAATIAGFNALLAHSLARNAESLVRARAAAELGSLRYANGRLVVGEAPDVAAGDAQVWVFSRGRTLEAPRAGGRVSATAARLAREPARSLDVGDTKLHGEPVVVGGRRVGTVVAAISLAPYEQTRRTALLASLALGAVVLLLVAIGARWLLASALLPVARMTRQASVWSDRELDERFGLGDPHDELTELAATLDALLDRVAAGLRRERRFSAELSHELRTPLARVLAETELALRRERAPEEYRGALEVVHRGAEQLARTVDALVASARYEAGAPHGTADAFAVATEAAAECEGVTVIPPPSSIRLGVDEELAERILQPILENACRYGRGSVHVTIGREKGAAVYVVSDDGPGVDESEREQIFDPGVRGRHGSKDGEGAGLGLALARRLARSVAGDVKVAEGAGGRFLVRLPTA